MDNASLTNEQARRLLTELATNDDFRLRFEGNPAAALADLGVPQEIVANLDAGCLAPMKLASKEAFQEAHRQFALQAAESRLGMIAPNLRLQDS